MTEIRVAVLSVHTSPLAPLGSHDSRGMNVYVRRLSEELGRLGVKVDVFTRRFDSHSATVVELAPNARLLHVRAGPARHVSKHELVAYLPEFVAGVKRLGGGGYALVHGHYYLSGWVGAMLADYWQIPHVQSFHTLARVKNRVLPETAHESAQRIDMEVKVMASADRIIATSPADKQDILGYYGVPPRKVSVIPPAVDANLFRPQDRQAARQRLGVQDKRVLLFVGRMDRIKGVDTLLSATASLLAADRSAAALTVLLVGGNRQLRVMDDASREVLRLHTLVRDLGLQQEVRFVGPKEQTELPAYYAVADVCVVPSYAESFGMTAVEAMACGTPVVASRVGGLQSTVVDGVTGFLVPRDHPEDFARRIRQVLDSSELRERLGRAAVEAAGRYQWSTVAEQLADLYCGLVHCPGSMAAA